MAISLICVFAHNLRRLYECRYIQFKKAAAQSKPATIQLPHFIVGIVFYIIVNSIYFLGLVNDNTNLATKVISAVFYVSLLLFGVSSYVQYICHVHLSRLVKYSLPSSPSDVPFASKIYAKIACPHYTAEIMVYVSLWGMFPKNRVNSLTWLLLVLWVTANLSISAEQTLYYYQKGAKEGLYGDKKSPVPANAIFPPVLSSTLNHCYYLVTMSGNNTFSNSFSDEDLKQKIASLAGKINSVKSTMAAAKEKKTNSNTTSYVQPYPAINSYSNSYYSSNRRPTIPTRSYHNRVYKHAPIHGPGRPHIYHNKTYYPPQPSPKAPEENQQSQIPSPSLPTTVSSLPAISSTPSSTPPINVVGSQNVVCLNGSQYISKNGTLIRVKNPVQQKQLADAISSAADTKSPNQTINTPPSTYIKTKSGSLVRVGGASNATLNNTSVKGRAKVNNKDVLLNPRVMAHCPQFTLTGKCTKGGRCPYARHDKNHLALCKQFLMQNGNCRKGSRCSLSHIPTDHNLPTCTYYLDGRCSSLYGRGHKEQSLEPSSNKKPTECKFAHPPKLAPGTPENKARKLCREFAYTGYCTLGSQKCPYVHSYQCPDFTETGSCNVRNCKLMHVNEGGNRHNQEEESKKPEKKEPEKINSLALARSLFEDSDDDDDKSTQTKKLLKNLGKNDSDGSDDSDDSDDDSEMDSDDEETREFLEFWKNNSARTESNEDEFKDSDYIKL